MPLRVTIASLPPTSDVILERDALMGVLQYGHTLDPAEVDEALQLPMRHPALDAVRQALAAQADRTRVGWASVAAESVREPYRSLAIELLTGAFPALTEAEAATSALALCRRLRVRAIDAQKRELLGAIQRVDPDSEEGRAVRVSLRELDVRRRSLAELQ
ncbi:MAG: hypothetical protein EOO67_01310 [Microbacterium sp.]|nr:MAG: hypothetical protein EOO67_01310 [Microbacterium sp.]